ncbi:MAG: cyclic nucleotide-binding domain-containing protein, partial [Bradymonadia bacterium]
DLMLMLKGSVEVLKGKEVINTIRGQNVFLGHLAFFGAQRRTASLRAKTRCEIVRVREDKVVGLLSVMPSLSVKLIRDIAEMFLQKEEQVTRFQKYGGGVRDAMKTQGIAEILSSFLPALVVSATCDVSREHQLEIILSLVDSLAPKLQFNETGVSRKSVPSEITNSRVRETIEDGILALIRTKTSGGEAVSDVSARGALHREEIADLCESIAGHVDSISAVRVSLGVESQLKKINRLTPRLREFCDDDLYPNAFELVVPLNQEVEGLVRFSEAQRNDESVREEAACLQERVSELRQVLESIVHIDRETALTRQLLSYFKFEV